MNIEALPVLPIGNNVLYPKTSTKFYVRKKSGIKAIEEAKDGRVLLTLKKNLQKDNVSLEDLYKIGTLAHIDFKKPLKDGGYLIKVTGLERILVHKFSQKNFLIEANGHLLVDKIDIDEKTISALHTNVQKLALEILHLIGMISTIEEVNEIEDFSLLVNMCAQNLDIASKRKQEFLEITSLKAKGLKILELMVEQREALKLEYEINRKLSSEIGKAQRQSLLREQLRAIQEELGEKSTLDYYEKKIEEAGMSIEAKEIALEESQRLKNMPESSPETSIIKKYLDLLCLLPWKTKDVMDIDLEKARKALDERHYGLEEIKKRIIQHLAVMKLKNNQRGSILLFVGPPGVGKTSLGKSIAKALEREFVKVSLGGVRDESEIRGHRRTYIGAMPGRIMQGIKRVASNVPVFMLDEIDKLAMGFLGDPASALLEVLDPEQNSAFLDHYLDVSYDLSNTFFIATANTLDTIPAPLLDRLEIIRLSGYTNEEKLHISQSYLVPKQLKEHGLTENQLTIGKKVQKEIIKKYTREAGVRELQRKIATICRASSEKVLDKNTKLPIKVVTSDLEEILGPGKFEYEKAAEFSVPGVVTGLAWTPLGGEILFIEASLMPGKGKLILTGQLGDVMQESAQIALSLVRASIPVTRPDFRFDQYDIHVHVPSGAIPKDGPSAGITIFSAIASLVLNKKIDSKLAMTGEITLRGAVMPVGGIKEKVLAAHRAGVKRIILSKKNKKDLVDISDRIKKKLEFIFVHNATEVIKETLNIDTFVQMIPQEEKINTQKSRAVC